MYPALPYYDLLLHFGHIHIPELAKALHCGSDMSSCYPVALLGPGRRKGAVE